MSRHEREALTAQRGVQWPLQLEEWSLAGPVPQEHELM